MSIDDYADHDALALADLIRRGDVRPSELAEEAIRRIERHNAVLNAVIRPAFEMGREAAARLDGSDSGAFRGVPFLLKDILGACAGLPVTSGSRMLRARMPRDAAAPHDSVLVQRFRAAGLVILGRTNVPEFGLLPTTEPAAFGPTRNPWNLEHTPGGSSGGSAAAAGIVPAAHANDGGGSIRIPASCCGLVGMKPTRARNSLAPDFGDIMNGLIAEHVVTRSVRDSAAILDATHGPAPGDPYWAPPVERPFLAEVSADPGRLRIAFSRTRPDGRALHADCVAAVESAARLCESLGHTVEERMPHLDVPALTAAFMALWTSGLAADLDTSALARGRPIADDEIEGLTWGMYQRGREITAAQYQTAVGLLQLMGRTMAAFHDEHDVWLTPTLGAPPLRLGMVDTSSADPAQALAPLLDFVPFTWLQNATGQPSISLPLHWSDAGLPIGTLFTGRVGDEALLFRLAGQLEQAQPWRQRRPIIWS
jgi:amidase